MGCVGCDLCGWSRLLIGVMVKHLNTSVFGQYVDKNLNFIFGILFM